MKVCLPQPAFFQALGRADADVDPAPLGAEHPDRLAVGDEPARRSVPQGGGLVRVGLVSQPAAGSVCDLADPAEHHRVAPGELAWN